MKRICRLLFISSLLFITSCSNSENKDNTKNENDVVVEKYSTTHLEQLKKEYGEFSITREDGGRVNYTYNAEKDEYRIKVEEVKAKYVLSGYSESHFIISNSDNLTTHKGIKLKLDKACLVSKNEAPCIYYSLETKNVEITPKNNTENLIVTLNGANGIDSENNIEIGGNGSLSIYTKDTTSYGSGGHCIKSSNKVSIYGSTTINLTSAHDGINCDDFLSLNEEDNTSFTGSIIFNDISSQAIEATTKKCSGSISLSGGKYTIDNAESIFKSDNEINISSGVEVIGTNIKSEPVVKQTKEEVESNITIPVLDLIVNGSLTSNGTSITTKKL